MKNAIKALVIDDEIEICYLLTRILKNRGIESTMAGTLSEARSLLKTFVPSVIFLDNHLPDGLGINFIHFLRKDFPNSRVIMITGQDTDLSMAFEKGISEIIFKPFTAIEIHSALEQVI